VPLSEDYSFQPESAPGRPSASGDTSTEHHALRPAADVEIELAVLQAANPSATVKAST
jgi:hypothetical protein